MNALKNKSKQFFERVIQYQVMEDLSVGDATEKAKVDFAGELMCGYSTAYVYQKLKDYEQMVYRNKLIASLRNNRDKIVRGAAQ